MMNSIEQNKNIYFTGTLTRKLSPTELTRIKQINDAYNYITDIAHGFNGDSNIRFKQKFPGFYSGTKEKGFTLHEKDDANSPQYYIYKFSASKPLNIKYTDGKDIVSCNLFGDILTIKAEDKVEQKYGFDKIFDKILNTIGEEINLLKEYCEFYPKLRQDLKIGDLKSTISKMISEFKKIQTSIGLEPEIKETYAKYQTLNKILNHDFLNVSYKLKSAYFKDEVTRNAKNLTFKTKGGNIKFCPIKGKDNRLFRVWKFDNKNNIKYAIIANSDGSISCPKDIQKYEDTRPHNLYKISDEEIKNLGIKKDFAFLCEKFEDFTQFIKDYTSKYKLTKGSPNVISYEELNRIKLEKEQNKPIRKTREEWLNEMAEKRALKTLAKEEEKKLKENAKLEKKALREEAKRKEKEAAKLERLAKKAEKKAEKEALKEAQKQLRAKVQKKFLANDLKQVNLSQLTKRIAEIFNTPVEKRSTNILHDTLSDNSKFSGRIYTIAPDDSKISITKTKSSKFMDFTYYSIKLEQGEISAYLNINPNNSEIILSTAYGQPIVNDNKIRYISKAQCVKITPLTDKIPQYLSFLLNAE